MIHDQIKSITDDDKSNDLCSALVSLDKAIGFCAMAQKTGYLMSLAYKNGKVSSSFPHSNSSATSSDGTAEKVANHDSNVRPYHLSSEEIARYAFHAGIMCGLHKFWWRKLGSTRYFVSYYNEIALVTIVLDDDHFLLMNIDLGKQNNVNRIISQKVIPFLQKGSPSITK